MMEEKKETISIGETIPIGEKIIKMTITLIIIPIGI